jgi:hypothetical protein
MKYAARMLRRSPGIRLAAILSVTLGIGTLTPFSLVQSQTADHPEAE